MYLKMTNTRQKLADSFSEGTFQLSLLQLHSIHSIEPVASAYKLTVANYDRQANFERDLLLFRCLSIHSITHSSRSQYASHGVDAACQGCLLSCELQVDHPLSGVQAQARNLEIAHVCHAISRLRTRVTQSRDCLRNFGILRMRSAISKLRKFSDCAEHIYGHRVQRVN